MKNRNGHRVMRPGQNGDYMLRSRTRSGSEEHEPMTIEYCSNYEELISNEIPPLEVKIDQLAAEAFTEEFQLIQSGDFVLTAPSCNNPASSFDRSQSRGGGLEEQREMPPPEGLGELGRTQTMSFDVDFPSIEKTYTTFINVAEDQIYPLEWKYFLEVAREDDDRLMPLSKERKGSSRKTSKSKRLPNNSSTVLPSESGLKGGNKVAPSNASINSDVNDSESLNSDARKFRLFPNIRDVASRRTKRMEAARSRRRLLDGKKDAKKEKKDHVKREKESVDLPSNVETKDALVPEQTLKLMNFASTLESPQIASPKHDEAPPVSTKLDSKSKISIPAITDVAQKAAVTKEIGSPTNGDISLHQLAEKIIGKEVSKSGNIDFTKRKRNGKKNKHIPAIQNSTSFPAVFSSEAAWDVTKSPKEVLSQDDEIVTYDHDEAAVDGSDTVTVMPRVETIFNDHAEKKKETLISSNKEDKSVIKPEKKSAIDSVLPAFALSKSFDDLYHSFVVKSIKKEIETPPFSPNGLLPDTEIPQAVKLESVPQSEPKWFGFGKQLWQHAVPSRPVENVGTHRIIQGDKEIVISGEEEKESIYLRDEVLAASFATSLSDILRSEISSISQAANEATRDISSVSLENKIDSPIDASAANENDQMSVVSCHTENDEVESLSSSTMTPVYPSFLIRAGSWLTRFGVKANGLAACVQNPFGESKVVKRSRRSKKIVVVPSLDRIQETSPTETRDEVDEDMEMSVSKDAFSRVDSRTSSVSINSLASSKSFDSDHSDSSSSDEEENASRNSSFDSAENVEVGWCG